MQEDTATREKRWGSELRYTYQITRGLSYGQTPSALGQVNAHGTRPPLDMSPDGGPRNCSVYIAFLEYDNNEYEKERSMRDYFLLPMNWLTVKMTGRQFIHVQPVFWDAVQKTYVTFSVDSVRRVHVYDRKGFRGGWKFLQLSLTEREEILMYNFCVQQLGKELNTSGQLSIFIWPISGEGQTWFCSELVAAALESAGLVDYNVWPEVRQPAAAAPHHIYDYLLKHCRRCPVTLLNGNPVSMVAVHRAAQERGKIELSTSALPTSIVSHATNSQQRMPNDLTSQLAAMPLAPPRVSTLDGLLIKK